ncbi:MAG TPA: serine/threonine-protein kinase [Gemmatimonadales bacterium]|jgi:serine/threonine-protein kinase
MASFCYVCGAATPAGLDRKTGEVVNTITGRSGIGPADLVRKLQRALGPGYELQDRIGAGGFAEVFRARDLRLKRELAVKVLRPDLGLSPELVQRFRREAETIATLRNNHIVPVYDIGEAEGLAFIIMPLISGESLRAVLDREGPMDPVEVSRILREAAIGLAAAHDAGVVHRDIKPENIMLDGREKRVLLMDFGIAKAVGAFNDGDPSQALTTTGIIIGTPQYMSPEQACGDKSIDARSDQYSLAVVGYRMLAGGLPFEGESTRAVLYQQLVAEPPPIETKVANVPPPLAHAIQRAMAKEPNDRYPTMLDFAAALDAEVAPAGAKPVTAVRRPRPAGKNRSSLFVMAGIAALVLIGALWALNRPTTSHPPVVQAAVPPAAPPAASVTPPPPPPPPQATTARTTGKGTTPPATNGAGSKGAKPRGGGAASPPPSGSSPVPSASTAAAPGLTCSKLAAAANWTQALPVCTREGDAGNAVSQKLVGEMYDKGAGTAANPAEAVKWYQRASSTDAEAKFLLSHLVEIGQGTPRDQDRAITLLRDAATAGFLHAQQVLAFRLSTGGGMKKNETEAAIWYRRAAERGDGVSQQALADALAHGRGVDKNETEALDWYKKAADQGGADAAWQAAQMYFKGHGAAKDETAGMVWLKKAATLNQPDAVKELKKRTGS